VDNDVTTSLYISGSPGSGKTALVNSILRSLETDAKIIVINCMALNSTDALWETLLEELQDGPKRKTAGRAKKTRPRDIVEALLSNSQSKWSALFFRYGTLHC
jgi:cell division control protein 6